MTFFYRDGEAFVPTEATQGPWDPQAQHAGPPSALLGRAIEQAPLAAQRDRDEPEGMQVVRVTVEVLRPVPLAPLRVETRVLRPGRSVQLVEATLSTPDHPVLRATGWRTRARELALPGDLVGGAAPPGPGTVADWEPGEGDDVGYFRAMQWRFVRGHLRDVGAATVWMRMRHPLVDDERPTPLQRVLIAADSGNGVSSVLDWDRWRFVNTDLTVYLHRPPDGEWVCLDAGSVIEPTGTGLAQSALYDERGPLGTSLQGLFVSPA